jgi:prepilin-type N-terminal cleavage/methylation domain-containing protein
MPWSGDTRCSKSRIENTGFTIVELLVVIAVVAALLAILIPGLGKAKAMAKRMKCASNLRQIDVAMRLYLSDNKDTYPCAMDPLDPNAPNLWLWMGRGWRGFIEPYLSEKIDVNNPSVLLCPADLTDPNKYESTSYSYSMAFYHSPQQINDMLLYADYPKYSTPQPSVSQESDRVTNPAGKIIVGEWNSNHRRTEQGQDKGWWGLAGCRNFLFANGKVLFLEAEKIRPANDDNPNPNLTIDGIEGVDWPR